MEDKIELFKLQDKISDLIEKAYKSGADADHLASMVFATGDAFGLLYGDHWNKDRLEIFRHELRIADEAEEDEENNLLF